MSSDSETSLLVLSEADLLLGKPFNPRSTYRHWCVVYNGEDMSSFIDSLEPDPVVVQFSHFYVDYETDPDHPSLRGYLQLTRTRTLLYLRTKFHRDAEFYPTKYNIYYQRRHMMHKKSIKLGTDGVSSIHRSIQQSSAQTNRRITKIREKEPELKKQKIDHTNFINNGLSARQFLLRGI